MAEPSKTNVDKMWAYARKFSEKSGTSLHPDVSVTEPGVTSIFDGSRTKTALLPLSDPANHSSPFDPTATLLAFALEPPGSGA